MESTITVSVEIPKSLYNEVKKRNIDIARTLNQALQKSIKIRSDEDDLKKGYEEMSEINLGLAEMCLEAENEALEIGERYLTECE